jgi:uncharacterized protein (DUF1501 family)
VQVRGVGPDGQPLTGVTVFDLLSIETLKGAEFTVRINPRPREGRQLVSYHKDKNLGFFLKDLRGDTSGLLTVKLQPCGSASGRMVDRDGQPVDAYATSERMAAVLRAEDKGASYPATGIAGRLRVIARMIKGGGDTRVFYTAQGSYDTHYTQLQLHAELLGELSGALKAFLDDLAAAQLADRVLVLCFSEFGRRAAENGSQGTDHGTAGPVLLAGPGVRAGLVGETPKLLDLQDGDLKMTVDFRCVYTGVLEDWLGYRASRHWAGTSRSYPCSGVDRFPGVLTRSP